MNPNPAPYPNPPAGGIRLFPPTEPPITGDPRALPLHETSHIRAAAHHAKHAFPGPIGEFVARELTAHAEFGYRFAVDGLLTQLANEVLSTPVPVQDRVVGVRAAETAETPTSTRS